MLIFASLSRYFLVANALLIGLLPGTTLAADAGSTLSSTRPPLSLASLFRLTVETAAKKQQSMTDAPSMVSVFSRDDIRRMGAHSLIDVLKYIPGTEVSMGVDGAWRVSIRGVRKDGNLLLLINGLASNDFYDGKAIFDLPTAFIEKVEIVRGSASPLFGTNAIGGIINVFTTSDNSFAQLGFGTQATQKLDLGYASEQDTWNYAIQAGYIGSDGPNVAPYSTPVPEAPADATTQRKIQDTYANAHITKEAFQANFWAFKRNQGPWVGPRYIMTEATEYHSESLRFDLSYKAEISEKFSIFPRAYLSYNLRDYDIEELPKAYTSGNSPTFTEGARSKENYTGIVAGMETQFIYQPTEALSILTGLVVERLELQDYNLTRNFTAGEAPIYVGDFGNWDRVAFSQRGRLRTVSGIYNESTFNHEKYTFSLGFRTDHYSDFGNAFNPHSAFVYKPMEALAFKLILGQSFRAPTFKELYDQTDTSNYGTLGNQKLDPETSQSQEIAMEFKFDRLITHANAYLNKTENLLESYDPQGTGGPAYYQNTGQLRNEGLELEGKLLLTQDWTLLAQFSQFTREFAWNSDIASPGDQTYIKTRGDQYLTNQPARRVNLALNGSFQAFRSFIGMTYGGASEANKRSALEGQRTTKIPSYVQGDLSLSYIASTQLAFQLTGNNIGAKKYSDPDSGVNINKMGERGMTQPDTQYVFSSRYEF